MRRWPRLAIQTLLSILLCAGLLLLACTQPTKPPFQATQQDTPPASAHPSEQMALDERLATHLEFLTSEFCHGREVGTSGAIRSALYVIDEFRSIGLTPAFRDTYVQSYVIPEMTCDNSAAFEVLDGRGKVAKAFVHLKDFAESYMPRWGKTVFQAPLALAPASDAGWTDLKRGSVVLVKSQTNDTSALARQIARTRGIAVLLSAPATADGPFAKRTAISTMPGSPLVFTITSECYDQLAQCVGRTVRVSLDAKGVSASGFNVAAVLGDPSKAPTVVVCAHRDSARGGSEEGMCPGAIDNASGTAALLEIARALKGVSPFAAAAVFVSTDGEEAGCTGAAEFAANLPFNKDKLAFVINLDCIAVRGANAVQVYATAGHSAATAARELILDSLGTSGYRAERDGEESGSDHRRFESKGYGAVFVHSGRAAVDPYYHTPEDDLEQVDPKALAAIVKAVSYAIANWR